MSSGVEALELEEKKSEDKREIADEEREKMLNEENKTHEPPAATQEKEVVEKDEQEVIVEDKKPEGEVEKTKKVLEESEKEKEKSGFRKKIPIGGIKMPGFLRSRSKEKANKDVEVGDVEEGTDLLSEPPCVAVTAGEAATDEESAPEEKKKDPSGRRLPTLPNLPALPSLPSIKFSNPFAKKPKEVPLEQTEDVAGDVETGEKKSENELEKEKDKEEAPKTSGSKRILDAIRLPLVSVFPRKLKSKDKLGQEPGAAGLASMETLDDSGEKANHGDNAADDGMESVKLDPVDTEKADLEKGSSGDDPDGKPTLQQRLLALDRWKLIIGGVVIFVLLLLIIILVAIFGPRSALKEAPLIDGRYVNAVTSCGLVQGVLVDGAFVFRGIPYARPPVADRRWLPAEPLESLSHCWNDTLIVHNATTTCWQIYGSGMLDGSEDCLTLDVITPKVRYDNPLPVVVLIGAESFTGDSPGILGASPKLAKIKDVIFVRPNFRLGVLGFLASDSLSRSVHPPTSGNYALSDIIAALTWIKRDIRNFGGDPDAVTLLGHRAGATMVTALTSSKKATKLFARAWVSSGSAILPGKSLNDSEATNAEYVKKFSCPKQEEAECLRRQDTEDLLDNMLKSWRRQMEDLPQKEEDPQKRHEWLVLDGDILREHPKAAWGTIDPPVKLVIGTTAHADASPELRNLFPDEEIIAKHIRNSVLKNLTVEEEAIRRYGSTWSGLVRMISDIRTVCPLYTIALGQPSVPFYVVNQTRDIGMGNLADIGADVAAILGHYEPRNPEQRRYVTAMQQLFYQFVWHGELKREDSDKKSNYNRVLIVGQDPIPVDSYSDCEFWIQRDIVPRYARID